MKHVLAVLLFTLATPSAVAQGAGIDERELAVYAALITHGLDGTAPLVVVASGTTGDPAAIAGHPDAPAMIAELGAPPGILADWQRRNAAPHVIEHPIDVGVSCVMLDDDTRATVFDGETPEVGWQRFFERYPGTPGLLRLSRAGFSDDFEHALVYVEHHCGADCGSGRVSHLVFDAVTGWQVLDAALVWMAE